MITLSNSGFKSLVQSTRSIIGNISVEMKTAEPNAERLAKFHTKLLNNIGDGLSRGFRESVAKRIPLTHIYYPNDFVKVWERFLNMPHAVEHLKKIGANALFKRGQGGGWNVDFETLQFAGFSKCSAQWMDKKGDEFTNINTNREFQTPVENLVKIKTMVRGKVFAGLKKSEAILSIKMYRSSTVRQNWGTQSQKLFLTLGSMCVKCGNPAMRTCDHVMPRSKRMDLATSLVNMQPLCQICNNEKDSDFVDYRTDLQRKAMLIAHFNYTVKTISDTKALIMYLEYGFTRRQIARELKITDNEVNTILARHTPYLEKMADYIETRRVYRRAYEELNSKVPA